MRIIIQTNDSLRIEENVIIAVVSEKTHIFSVSRIEEVLILTTNMGPICDDMCLVLRFDNKDDLFIMSEHRDYKTFLFEQLGEKIKLNFEQIIAATMSVDDNTFSIYKR